MKTETPLKDLKQLQRVMQNEIEAAIEKFITNGSKIKGVMHCRYRIQKTLSTIQERNFIHNWREIKTK